MRFLADQDVYQATIDFLRSHGHSVLRAYDLGLSRAEDTVLLERAVAEGRVLVTRDKDFGALTFVPVPSLSGSSFCGFSRKRWTQFMPSCCGISKNIGTKRCHERSSSWSRAVIEFAGWDRTDPGAPGFPLTSTRLNG